MKKNIIKCLIFSVIVFVCSMILTISIYAEDYRCDVSSAVMTEGKWGQSYTEYTPLETDRKFANNFNPLWMTEQSEVIVEYELDAPDGELSESPVELIWQTWDGPVEPNPDAVKWAKVSPYEYDRMTAKFSYADIVKSYGTSDFSAVYAVNIGDTGTNIKVTSLTITNIDRGVSHSESAGEVAVETVTEAPAAVSGAVDTKITVLIIAAAVLAVVAAVVGASVFRKKRGN